MMILTLRTDKPEAEIGLFDDTTKVAYEQWAAGRQLAETIHRKIDALLVSNDLGLKDIKGIVCFEGPGSFTGLRIGLTVANTLAYALGVPIVGAQDPDWVMSGIRRLENSENDRQVVPFYGAEVHITPQKK